MPRKPVSSSQETVPNLSRTHGGIALRQIATHAGVSLATVSRVLNNHPSVRSRTGDLVRRTIAELQAAQERSNPRTAAAPLRRRETRVTQQPYISGNSGNIAMVFLGWGSIANLRPVYLQLMSGIRSQLEELGLRMMIVEVADAAAVEEHFQRGDIDGAITLLSTRTPPTLTDVARLAALMPTVRVMGTHHNRTIESCDIVTPQHQAVGHMAFDYLLSKGCKRLAFVTLGVNTPELGGIQGVGVLRSCMSFVNAARMADIPVDVYWTREDPAISRLFGDIGHCYATPHETVKALCRDLPHGQSGVFVGSDFDVATLVPLMRDLNVRPEIDLTLIGCDNVETQLAPLNPRPASVDIRTDEIGRQAILRLIQRIQNPHLAPSVIEITPRVFDPSNPPE